MENIPTSGAVISGNHVSNLDPMLLWCRSPRPVRMMGKAELWDYAFVAWALPRIWGFPVRRGEADRQAIQLATEFLKQGDIVGIFPEGTRNREGEGKAHGGAAFIAMRAGVPIVPLGIAGTEGFKREGSRMIRFPRVTMSFGKPLHPDEFEGTRRERVAAFTDELMRRISEELDKAREL